MKYIFCSKDAVEKWKCKPRLGKYLKNIFPTKGLYRLYKISEPQEHQYLSTSKGSARLPSILDRQQQDIEEDC